MIFLGNESASGGLVDDAFAQLKLRENFKILSTIQQIETHLNKIGMKVSWLFVVVHQFHFNHVNCVVGRLQDILVKLQEKLKKFQIFRRKNSLDTHDWTKIRMDQEEAVVINNERISTDT